MAASRTYSIGEGWKGVLAQVGVDASAVLRRAGLPEDLLRRDEVQLSTASFLGFFEAIDATVDDPSFWVRFTEATSPEFFTPPVFAALCSPNLAVAAKRVSRFKPLLGPIVLDVRDDARGLVLTYRWKQAASRQVPFMNGLEALFVTRLARLGTRERVRPRSVVVPALARHQGPFEEYLGVPMTEGGAVQVTFDHADAHLPFVTANRAMWDIFEPELRKRLADLEGDATFTERTRAVLMEALPAGQVAVDHVARRLAVSARTLQRRLRGEGTSFQAVIDATRESLARHYLLQTRLTATEIAYLLGFDEATSFFRAFQRWTGTTPETVRQQQLPVERPPLERR